MEEVKEKEKLPEGWRRVRLGEVTCERVCRYYQIKQINETPVLTSSRKGIFRQEEYFNRIVASQELSKYKIAKHGDIVFRTMSDDGIFVFNLLDKFEFGIVSPAYSVFYGKEGKIEIKFLFYYLNSGSLNLQIYKSIQGTTRTSLKYSNISNFFISLPPLPEQRKIAEILETIDNAIEKTDQIIEKYKRIKQGLMQELLTKGINENGQIRSEKTHKFKDSPLGRIPEEWEVVRFRDICKVRQGLQIAIVKRFKEPGPKRYVYITIQYLNLKNKEKDAEYIQNPPKSVICEKDDLLMTRTGNTGIVITDVEGVFHNNFFLVNYDKREIDKMYLFYYLNLCWIQEKIKALAGTTTIPDLNHDDFYSLIFLKPLIPEQQRIASILSQIDEVIEKEQNYKQKLERIKQGLMEDLLTGNVRVNCLIEGKGSEC